MIRRSRSGTVKGQPELASVSTKYSLDLSPRSRDLAVTSLLLLLIVIMMIQLLHQFVADRVSKNV